MEAYKFNGARSIADVIAYDVNPAYTCENRLVAAGVTAMDIGTVYGIVTADGTIKPHDNAASDGTQNAAGILLVRGAAGDRVAGLENGPAIAFDAALIFKAGISAPNRAAAITALAAKSIKVR
jgi:hypothetical protein